MRTGLTVNIGDSPCPIFIGDVCYVENCWEVWLWPVSVCLSVSQCKSVDTKNDNLLDWQPCSALPPSLLSVWGASTNSVSRFVKHDGHVQAAASQSYNFIWWFPIFVSKIKGGAECRSNPVGNIGCNLGHSSNCDHFTPPVTCSPGSSSMAVPKSIILTVAFSLWVQTTFSGWNI